MRTHDFKGSPDVASASCSFRNGASGSQLRYEHGSSGLPAHPRDLQAAPAGGNDMDYIHGLIPLSMSASIRGYIALRGKGFTI